MDACTLQITFLQCSLYTGLVAEYLNYHSCMPQLHRYHIKQSVRPYVCCNLSLITGRVGHVRKASDIAAFLFMYVQYWLSQ